MLFDGSLMFEGSISISSKSWSGNCDSHLRLSTLLIRVGPFEGSLFTRKFFEGSLFY
jgi:hypothetical protein